MNRRPRCRHRALPALAAALLACCTAALALPLAAQLPADTVIAGPALQADVDLLARAYETLHPGLHRYQAPAEWRARVGALRSDVAGGMGRRAFFIRVAALLATVRCGHTYPNFFNQREAVFAGVVTAGRRLPLHFRWVGDEMVVTRDLSGRGIAPGTRVTAIDGVPAATVLARLMPLARADGANDAKRREILSVTGGETHEAFDVYHPLVFTVGDSATLSLRAPAGRVRRTVRVATQRFAEREAIRASDAKAAAAASATAANPLGWTMRSLPDGTALLVMPSWSTYEHEAWDWRAWLDAAMTDVAARRVPRLVVDLRENEGGNEAVGDALLAAFATRPVVVPNWERWVRYRTLPADLRPYATTWDRSFDSWAAAITGDTTGPLLRIVRSADGPDTLVVRPAARGYTGRVAVLVGAVNSSSTFAFARAVKASGAALLVGQPTGGNQRGINGGAFYFFRLPGSGIEVDVPLIGYYPPGRDVRGVRDGGIDPDVPVARSAGDVARGTDRELAAAIRALGRAPRQAAAARARRG